MKEKRNIEQYLRVIISYTDISAVRVLHYAVRCDSVDDFVSMIQDTFVHPDISFTDILYSFDTRKFFQLI